MASQLDRILNLARKTGDRIVVFNESHPDQAYVVMDIDQYEKIVEEKKAVRGMTEEELLTKINRDIAFWRHENQVIPAAEYQVNSGREEEKSEEAVDKVEARPQKIEKLEEKVEAMISEKRARPRWAIKQEIKAGAEEVMEEGKTYINELSF